MQIWSGLNWGDTRFKTDLDLLPFALRKLCTGLLLHVAQFLHSDIGLHLIIMWSMLTYDSQA
jgi:hypothetical protein